DPADADPSTGLPVYGSNRALGCSTGLPVNGSNLYSAFPATDFSASFGWSAGSLSDSSTCSASSPTPLIPRLNSMMLLPSPLPTSGSRLPKMSNPRAAITSHSAPIGMPMARGLDDGNNGIDAGA